MGKKILVIPDMHHHEALLDIWTAFEPKVDYVILLGDFFDDFEVKLGDLEPYYLLYQQLMNQTNEKVAWVAGNHEMSYVWNRPVTGNFPSYHPDYVEVQKMAGKIYTLSTPAVKIDNCIFSHAGIGNAWVNSFYANRNYKKEHPELDIDNPDQLLKQMKDEFWFGHDKIERFWNNDSPLWLRPDWNDKKQYKKFKGCWQFTGHTPVDDIVIDKTQHVVLLDTFSARELDYNDMPTRFGSQTCIIVDSKTCRILEKIVCRESN